MCGIAGWILNEKPNENFVFSLAFSNLQRGEDSWGYFDGATIRKAVGPITEGIRPTEMLSQAGFLHTRAATTGKVKAKNAHPFQIGDIIGAHNGIIYNHRELAWDYPDRKCAVDSEHIFHQIVEDKPLTELEGYGAIEYIRKGEYFIGVCNHGALVVAKLKNGIVWASLEESIRAAVFQAGYEIEHYYKIEEGKTYRVTADMLYETEIPFQMAEKWELPSTTTGTGAYGGYGNYIAEKYGVTPINTARDRQENWGDENTTDIPPSMTMLSDGACTAGIENYVYDECEFCGEIADLKELDGSFICEGCREVLT